MRMECCLVSWAGKLLLAIPFQIFLSAGRVGGGKSNHLKEKKKGPRTCQQYTHYAQEKYKKRITYTKERGR